MAPPPAGPAARPQALCVLNVRRHAFELWEELRNILVSDERDAVFHLSSAMCAQHRFDLLGDDKDPAAATMGHRLRTGQPCRSLLEATSQHRLWCLRPVMDTVVVLFRPAGRVTHAALRRIEETVRYCLGL